MQNQASSVLSIFPGSQSKSSSEDTDFETSSPPNVEHRRKKKRKVAPKPALAKATAQAPPAVQQDTRIRTVAEKKNVQTITTDGEQLVANHTGIGLQRHSRCKHKLDNK